MLCRGNSRGKSRDGMQLTVVSTRLNEWPLTTDARWIWRLGFMISFIIVISIIIDWEDDGTTHTCTNVTAFHVLVLSCCYIMQFADWHRCSDKSHLNVTKTMYKVARISHKISFLHRFIKYWPIFKILLLSHSAICFQKKLISKGATTP